MKYIIFGQGMKRSDVGDQLDNNTYQAMVCLAQLYLYPFDNSRNHWINELWNKFPDVLNFKRLKSGRILNLYLKTR